MIGQLSAYDWPGNVRELRNHVTRMVALPDAPLPSPLPSASAQSPLSADLDVPLRVAKQRAIDAVERAYVGALLAACDGRVADVARRAGMDRMSIYRIIDKLELRSSE